MTWLFDQIWPWVLTSALFGFAITMLAMLGPGAPHPGRRRPVEPGERAGDPDHRDWPDGSARPTGHSDSTTASSAAASVTAASSTSVGEGEDAPRRPRRRSYEVEDVEVAAWEAGHEFRADTTRDVEPPKP